MVTLYPEEYIRGGKVSKVLCPVAPPKKSSHKGKSRLYAVRPDRGWALCC